MTAEQAAAFFVFAIASTITPGPNNVMLTATGANVGLLRGLPHLFGIAVGFGFMSFVVALGLGSLVIGTSWAMTAIQWAGAALLLWFAWRIATAGRSDTAGQTRPFGFFAAVAFQWVNPKAWFIATSAVGTYLQAGTSATVKVPALRRVVYSGDLAVRHVVARLWRGIAAPAARARVARVQSYDGRPAGCVGAVFRPLGGFGS